MAILHPTPPLGPAFTLGLQREHDVLRLLEAGLSDEFDVFHSLDWSSVVEGRQHHGEIDVAVVAPSGHIVLLEIKAGRLIESGQTLGKQYGTGVSVRTKDVGHQVRRMYSALRTRLREADLDATIVTTMLVLPDHRVQSTVLAFPGDRVVDAGGLQDLPHHVRQANAHAEPMSQSERARIISFLAQMLDVLPDVATHIGLLRSLSTTLSSGLATWVPKIGHASGAFIIDATAGSGKTQLAIKLLYGAHLARQRGAYVCFNRPLADHLARIAPTSTEVGSFHELCLNQARQTGFEPRFDHAGVFDELAQRWAEQASSHPPRWDLLVIDETQDFAPEWIQTLLNLLKPDGRVYLLGDSQQRLYDREAFHISDAVTICCQDNFRSPRAVVEAINRLRLLSEPAQARSAYEGESPAFSTYAPGELNAITTVASCITRLQQEGVALQDIALLTYAGQQRSEVLQQESIAGATLRKFTGRYDKSGNAQWTDGDLLSDTVFRFKGQSAPVVVLCEIDFEPPSDQELRRLFVGLTRAQYRVECIMSERAAAALMQRLDAMSDGAAALLSAG